MYLRIMYILLLLDEMFYIYLFSSYGLYCCSSCVQWVGLYESGYWFFSLCVGNSGLISLNKLPAPLSPFSPFGLPIIISWCLINPLGAFLTLLFLFIYLLPSLANLLIIFSAWSSHLLNPISEFFSLAIVFFSSRICFILCIVSTSL